MKEGERDWTALPSVLSILFLNEEDFRTTLLKKMMT